MPQSAAHEMENKWVFLQSTNLLTLLGSLYTADGTEQTIFIKMCQEKQIFLITRKGEKHQ